MQQKATEAKAIEMRYLGRKSKEIAEATGYNESHVRRLFMREGRLEKAYEEYLLQQKDLIQEMANAVLQRARDEASHAIERMVALSKDASNEAVAFKANEYLLTISGVLQENTLKGLLQSKSYEQAQKLVDETFQALYGKGLENVQRIEITYDVPDGISPLRQSKDAI